MRTDLEARLCDRQSEDGYLFPAYEDYCFANVPATVARTLGVDDTARRPLPEDVLEGVGDDYDRVLVVVVDGFGLAFWKRHDHPLLERLEAAGTVSPLTATYPSETAAAMTTFHTGRSPASHGILGWDVYDPLDDASYEAFTGTVKAGDESVDRDLQDIFAGEPIYSALAAAGIDCHHVVPFAETYDGAIAHSYEWNSDDAVGPTGEGTAETDAEHEDPAPDREIQGFVTALEDAFAAADDPAYCYAYLPQIDAAAHVSGTRSDAYRESVETTFDALERALSRVARADDAAAGDTLVVVTADHGHVDTNPETNVDLETDDELVAALERHATGEPVRYAGSPRNLHLHLREPAADRERIRARLEDRLEARILTREAVLERDLFGDGPESETFRRRLGDLIVCHRDRSVWFGSDRAHLELIGVHGGLHPDEMLVPFAVCEFDELLA